LPVINISCLLIAGVLVAADQKLPLWLVFGLASIIGMVCGFFNGTAMNQAGGGFRALLGIASGVFVIAALISAGIVSLKKAWMRIAVRVSGSWIAAIGLLMLGWLFKAVA
jgi:hydrogenase/urease accessory protein HupE